MTEVADNSGTHSDGSGYSSGKMICVTSAIVGWQTYTNSDYGYFIEYPAGWSATANPIPASIATILQVNNGSVAKGTNTDGFIVNYYGSITDLKNSGSEYKNIASVDDYIAVNYE